MKSDEIFRRLTFGVKATKKTKQAAQVQESAESNLRIRVVPEKLKDEIKELKGKIDGSITAPQSHSSHTGIELLSGHKLSIDEMNTGIQSKMRSSEPDEDVNRRKLVERIAQLRRLNRIFVWGDDISEPLFDFADLDLPSSIASTLKEFELREPTPIQMQGIPIMMQKRDILASAPTGSGKTLAFALPVILEVLRVKNVSKSNKSKLLSIVLEPTRELAAQTYRQFLKLSCGVDVRVAHFDDEQIPTDVDVLISTPNRLNYHLDAIDLQHLRWLVVDESDRLFEVIEGQDKCFRNQLASVYKACDGKWTRRAFFSATFSHEVEKWCKENLRDVAMVCIGERNSANSSVKQELVYASSEHGKVIAVRQLLTTQFEPPALIFVQSKERARELVAAISQFYPPVSVAFISSEKSQQERDEVLEKFRGGSLWVLVCTELLGRGLDLRNVNLVINYDLPTSVISYIHRVGRTGRAGRIGRSITYFTESDTKFLRPIATVIHQAGFDVPEYTLSLKQLQRGEKQKLLRHAPRRGKIAFLEKKKKKIGKGKKKVQKDSKIDGVKSGKVTKKKVGTKKSKKSNASTSVEKTINNQKKSKKNTSD